MSLIFFLIAIYLAYEDCTIKNNNDYEEKKWYYYLILVLDIIFDFQIQVITLLLENFIFQSIYYLVYQLINIIS